MIRFTRGLAVATCAGALFACNRAPIDADRPGASPQNEPPPTYENPSPQGGTVQTPASDMVQDDQRITQQVRQRLRDDESLSADAKNVVITTTNRKVTLDGHVASEAERVSLANHVRDIEGVTDVETSGLTVMSTKEETTKMSDEKEKAQPRMRSKSTRSHAEEPVNPDGVPHSPRVPETGKTDTRPNQ